MSDAVAYYSHSGGRPYHIQQTSPRHNTQSAYYNPTTSFQNQFHRPIRRIHRVKQFKHGITMLLYLSSEAYITQKHSRRTILPSTNYMKSFEQSTDDHGEDDSHGANELDLWYRFRTTQRSSTKNDIDTPIEYKSWYDSASTKITNVSSYMENFHSVEFDNWGRTYDEMMRGMYSWKSHYFKDLKSNDSIYESACGIGMNLYMTLEILQQALGITNITISGNDYVSSSVQIAQDIYSNNGTFHHALPFSFGQLGSIYEADSTQLDFIPSNSFDLVYTGYISPLNEPLDSKQTYNAYREQLQQEETRGILVDAASTPTLAEKQQLLQDDWYGKWVGEMIRIAKPGVPIIVEQVSYPYVCQILWLTLNDVVAYSD
jgi:SAM-dependent methyltransferase